jgi:aarF domain-containing kinase
LPSPPALLRRLFERLGATYIKLGQFIASSPTLFPEEYVVEMQKCLDATPVVPFEAVRRIVEQDLGRPLSAMFESVDPVPLASASVAQVHAAVLAGSRKRVVLKVRKPGVEDALSADLAFLAASAKVLEFLAPELGRGSVAAIAGDVRASMLDELDFGKEARNVTSFRAFLEASGITTCVAPFVYEAMSSTRVLTMERLDGVPLTDLSAIAWVAARRGTTPEAVLISALNTWSLSVIACESFHADLHAGNLLVLPDARVAFIDFGIVGRVSPATWVAVQALLEAAAGGDWRTAAAALVTMGAADADVDIDAFGADLKGLMASDQGIRATLVVDATAGGDVPGVGVALDETDVTRLVLQLVRVGDAHGVKFPRQFGLLLKQVLYFDRYQRALAPQLDVLNDPRVQLRDSMRGRKW